MSMQANACCAGAAPAPEKIRDAVRRHYTDAVERGSGCCDGAASLGYDGERLAAVPESLREASLGCGSPVDAAELVAGEVVVDLGSGAGLDVMLAARAVGPGGRVYGVDMTPAMLERSRATAARLGLEQVTVLEGDIESLPLPDATADVVISNCVINLAPDKERVFREAFRVLKPGGRIVFADLVRVGPPPTAVDLEQWSACVAGAVTLEEYGERLRQAGFVDNATLGDREYELRSASAPCCDGTECGCGGGASCCTETRAPEVRSVVLRARKPRPGVAG
jgi:SAM-dependent methyltransferase